uniref:MBTPS1 fourth domain-containing protein n=1 Tax=Haptolina brevifila TaxID=156173 RepID=A0A7S2H5C6_9EUKA
MHTNFRDLFIWLRENGYYVESLGCAFTCFNASQYAALLLIDSEADYGPLEARKLRHDIVHLGLSLVVLADWYSPAVMKSLRFFDENTQSWWTPVTGGANVRA